MKLVHSSAQWANKTGSGDRKFPVYIDCIVRASAHLLGDGWFHTSSWQSNVTSLTGRQLSVQRARCVCVCACVRARTCVCLCVCVCVCVWCTHAEMKREWKTQQSYWNLKGKYVFVKICLGKGSCSNQTMSRNPPANQEPLACFALGQGSHNECWKGRLKCWAWAGPNNQAIKIQAAHPQYHTGLRLPVLLLLCFVFEASLHQLLLPIFTSPWELKWVQWKVTLDNMFWH